MEPGSARSGSFDHLREELESPPTVAVPVITHMAPWLRSRSRSCSRWVSQARLCPSRSLLALVAVSLLASSIAIWAKKVPSCGGSTRTSLKRLACRAFLGRL